MKILFKKITLPLYILISSLALLEVTLRVNFIQSFFPVDVRNEILILESSQRKYQVNQGMPHHPYLHHWWGSNVRTNSTDKRYGEDYSFETNGNGWLVDHEIINPKPKNTYRIFYMGDSNTQGIMERGLNLTNIIEKKLKLTWPNVEVINTGTSSYSTLIYFILLKKYILDYQPDLIILNFDMTDVGNDLHYLGKLISDSEGNPAAIIPEDPAYSKFILTPIGPVELSTERMEIKNKYLKLLVDKSMTGKYIYAIDNRRYIKEKVEYYYKHSESNADIDGAWTNLIWSNATKKGVDYSMGILEKVFKLAKDANVPIILSTSPNQDQINGLSSDKPFQILDEVSKRNNVVFIDTYSEFMNKYSVNELNRFYFSHEKDHLNSIGNMAWAEIQYPYIESVVKRSYRESKVSVK